MKSEELTKKLKKIESIIDQYGKYKLQITERCNITITDVEVNACTEYVTVVRIKVSPSQVLTVVVEPDYVESPAVKVSLEDI